MIVADRVEKLAFRLQRRSQHAWHLWRRAHSRGAFRFLARSLPGIVGVRAASKLSQTYLERRDWGRSSRRRRQCFYFKLYPGQNRLRTRGLTSVVRNFFLSILGPILVFMFVPLRRRRFSVLDDPACVGLVSFTLLVFILFLLLIFVPSLAAVIVVTIRFTRLYFYFIRCFDPLSDPVESKKWKMYIICRLKLQHFLCGIYGDLNKTSRPLVREQIFVSQT